MQEKTIETSMSIIMAAGDARLLCTQALAAIAAGDVEKAESLHTQSKKKIAEAHGLQTDAIQGEMAGGPALEYSALFSHAQDTLMTVYSEINITKQLFKIFNNYETRFADMENRLQQLENK